LCPFRLPCSQEDLLESGADLGELDACRHRFCFPCISKWAAIENSCPFCKQRFARLRRKRLAPRDVLLAGGGLDPASELPGVYVDTQQVEERNQVRPQQLDFADGGCFAGAGDFWGGCRAALPAAVPTLTGLHRSHAWAFKAILQ
jgi:hypothetical protein